VEGGARLTYNGHSAHPCQVWPADVLGTGGNTPPHNGIQELGWAVLSTGACIQGKTAQCPAQCSPAIDLCSAAVLFMHRQPAHLQYCLPDSALVTICPNYNLGMHHQLCQGLLGMEQ
jgi:hypothetical protein